MSRSKNCLTCAFCTRNQDTWITNPFKSDLSRWKRAQKSLNLSERELLGKGEDGFIGEEIRSAKEWDEHFKTERQREQNTQEGELLAYIRSLNFPFGGNDVNKEAAKYGMPERPKAPDEDYLSCFHQQWDENKDSDIQKDRLKFLKTKKCRFHYKFSNTHGETLDACEKNRKESQERSRFSVTTILIVVGIIVTIAVGVLPLLSAAGLVQWPIAPAPGRSGAAD
jgi:hypothetical protein